MTMRRHLQSETAVKPEEASNDSTVGNDFKCNVKEEDSNENATINQSNISTVTKNISGNPTFKIKQEDAKKFEIKLNETTGTQT